MAKDSRTLCTHVVEATVPLIHRKAGILVNEAVFNDAVVRIWSAEHIYARKFLSSQPYRQRSTDVRKVARQVMVQSLTLFYAVLQKTFR